MVSIDLRFLTCLDGKKHWSSTKAGSPLHRPEWTAESVAVLNISRRRFCGEVQAVSYAGIPFDVGPPLSRAIRSILLCALAAGADWWVVFVKYARCPSSTPQTLSSDVSNPHGSRTQPDDSLLRVPEQRPQWQCGDGRAEALEGVVICYCPYLLHIAVLVDPNMIRAPWEC